MSKGMESVVYELGRKMSNPLWSPDTVQEMVDQLIETEVLIDEDGRGNGWVLEDGRGNRRMPGDTDKVFEDKGSAFLFWWGLGEPDGHRLVVYCDPRVEADEVFPSEGIMTIEDAIVEQEETASQIHAVTD